jgi:O-antigen/teichoic acid export membrane protein
MAISIVLAFTFSVFFDVPEGREIVIKTVLIVMGLNLALGFPFRVFSGVLRATMKFHIGSAITIVMHLLKAGLVVLALTNQGGLVSLALITLGVSICAYSFSTYYAFKELPTLRVSLKLVEMRKAKEVLNYSIHAFVIMMGDLLRFNLDSIIIGAMLSLSAITPFAIAQKLIRFPVMLMQQIFSVTTPLYSSYETKGDFKSIQKLLINSTFYSALISFFIAVMFVVYGEIFITLWVGKQYAMNSYHVLVILSISYCIALAQNPSIAASYGIEKHKVLGIITVIEGVLNLILTIIFVKQMGLIGVALGTAIPMALMKGVVQPFYICRILNLSHLRYLRKCFFVPLCTALVFALLHVMAKNYVQIDEFFEFVIAVILSGCVFMFFVAILIYFNSDQKAYWKGLFTSLKQRTT